jgi:hypothetical protein
LEDKLVKRVAAIAVAGLLCLIASCGGGGTTTPAPTGGPLKIVFVAASPDNGGSPLRATLTANISGGTAPYFYAWDYSNDGSFDDYFNNIFLRTLSVQHDFFLTSTDGSNTVYHAVLRLTDSAGTTLTSEPVTITVTPGSNLQIDDVQVFSSTQGPTGGYILKSGEPVFFQPTVSGGTQPYTYQWDFDKSGSVDSTISNPQYTYTYPGTGTKNFVAHLRVVDAEGNTADRDVLVVGVEGAGNTGNPGGGTGQPGFTIVINSNPPVDSSSGAIILNWDASANDPSLPLEPQLQLSVVVDTSSGGVPPFEYYWDFENDGSFDTQVVSPTIPYYDTQRKILVNPYLHQERTKSYTLRVFVIDSHGQLQTATRTIISNNVENSAGTLDVVPSYGIAASATTFKDTPPQPYKAVQTEKEETDVLFKIDPTGSTGAYDWQLDIDGDGVADWPAIANQPTGFQPITKADDKMVLVKFGFHDDGAGGKIAEWPALGYYAANATVRSLDTSTNPATVKQTFKVLMPVSLVRRETVPLGSGMLTARRGMVMGGTVAPATGNPNGNFIPSRNVVIAGGFTGTTPLRDVQMVTQTFNPPTAPNTLETLASSGVTDKLPMNTARGGATGCTDGTTMFVVGGRNLDNGILGLTENQPLLANPGWAVGGNINIPQYFPVTEAAGCFMSAAVGGTGPGLVFAGGLHAPGGSDVDDVSGLLVFSDLQDKDGNAANGIQLSFTTLPSSMVTERYDACMAFANSKLYVIGGRVADGRSVSTVESYNFLTGQWENQPSLQDFRSGASCEVIKDETGTMDVIYVLGGSYYPSNGGNQTIVNTAEAFNTKTGKWSYTVAPPNGTDNGATCALAGPGSAVTIPAVTNQIWYFGGAGAGGAESNALYEFTYFYTVQF